eukprot:g17125.t1
MVLPLRRKFIKQCVCLSAALAWPLTTGVGTFESTFNASAFPRIYNASESNEDWLGYSCASIGDFNGDGIGDVIVGAPGASSGVGRAYIIYGNYSGIDEDVDVSTLEERDYAGLVLSGSPGGNFSYSIGFAVAAAGDVNGDNLMDVMIGAYGSSYLEEGAAHVVYGTNTSAAYEASYLDFGAGDGGGLDGVDGFTLTGVMVEFQLYAELLPLLLERHLSTQYTGNPLSSAGDVNGDGYDDILVGSPTAGTLSQGHTYLVFGGADLPARVDLTASDDASGGNDGVVVFKGALTDESGFSVSGGFDMNGDGLSDFIIGAPEGGTVGEFDGEAYVVFGQENLADFDTVMLDTELDGTVGFSIMGPSEDAYAGSAVSGIGDVNSDGYDDVLVGAFGDNPNGRYRAGAAFVIFGRAEGDFAASYDLKSSDVVDGTTATSFFGLRAEDALGIGVGSAGDLNGDGVVDVWIGAPNSDSDTLEDAGSVFVIFGWKEDGDVSSWGPSVDISTLDGTDGFVVAGSTAKGHFGWTGAANVDVNCDGVSDLLIGAFLVPGLYMIAGDDGSSGDNNSAVILAIVSGVLGCLFCVTRELRVWLAKREAKAEEERKEREAKQRPVRNWKLGFSKLQQQQLKTQASVRDINQGCEIVDPAS